MMIQTKQEIKMSTLIDLAIYKNVIKDHDCHLSPEDGCSCEKIKAIMNRNIQILDVLEDKYVR